MLIASRMTINPITATPDMTIQAADAIMKQERIHILPVMDDNHKLVGIISEKDILKAMPSPVSTLSAYEMNFLINELTVKKIMSRNPLTISTDTTVEEAARIMVDRHISCLPILEDSKLVGIVTKTDMLKMLLEMFGSRNFGVRVECMLENRPGTLASLSKALADKNIQILTTAVLNGPDPSKAITIIKVQSSDKKTVTRIVEEYAIEIIDVREL